MGEYEHVSASHLFYSQWERFFVALLLRMTDCGRLVFYPAAWVIHYYRTRYGMYVSMSPRSVRASSRDCACGISPISID